MPNMNRFNDALQIIGYDNGGYGASNYSGVLYSALYAIKACKEESVNPADDPAVRLMIWWVSDTLVCAHEGDMLPQYEHMRDLPEVINLLLEAAKAIKEMRGNQAVGTDMTCRALTGQLAYICRTDTISKWFGQMYSGLADLCKERAGE